MTYVTADQIKAAITKAESDITNISYTATALQTAVNDAQRACSNAQTAHSTAVLVYQNAKEIGSPTVNILHDVMDNAYRAYRHADKMMAPIRKAQKDAQGALDTAKAELASLQKRLAARERAA